MADDVALKAGPNILGKLNLCLPLVILAFDHLKSWSHLNLVFETRVASSHGFCIRVALAVITIFDFGSLHGAYKEVNVRDCSVRLALSGDLNPRDLTALSPLALELDGSGAVARAGIVRTARKLMDGEVF